MALDKAWRELVDAVASQILEHLRDNPTPLTPWMNPAQAAAYLNVAVRALETMRREDRGPKYSRVGRIIVRYHIRHLDAWLKTHEMDTGDVR